MADHPLSDGPLPFGEIWYGQTHYQEFACSKSTVSWLQAGGMTHIDGQEIRLQIMDECVGGHNVMVRIWPEDSPAERVNELEQMLGQETVAWR